MNKTWQQMKEQHIDCMSVLGHSVILLYLRWHLTKQIFSEMFLIITGTCLSLQAIYKIKMQHRNSQVMELNILAQPDSPKHALSGFRTSTKAFVSPRIDKAQLRYRRFPMNGQRKVKIYSNHLCWHPVPWVWFLMLKSPTTAVEPSLDNSAKHKGRHVACLNEYTHSYFMQTIVWKCGHLLRFSHDFCGMEKS